MDPSSISGCSLGSATRQSQSGELVSRATLTAQRLACARPIALHLARAPSTLPAAASPSSYLASGMSACSPPPAAWSIASVVGALGLVGHFLELGVRQDQLDHLALDDLVPQHVHRAASSPAGPHAPRRLAALLGDQRESRPRNPLGSASIFSSSAIRSRMKCSFRARAVRGACCSAAGRSRGRGSPRR